MTRVIVVGAGLSGLSCAFELAHAGIDVRVFESAERPGGVVGSERIGDFLFERGPNTIQAGSVHFRELCGKLGLGPRMIATTEVARDRSLLWKGRLVSLPHHPLGVLSTQLLSARAKLKLASEPLRRRPPHPPDAPEPSLAAFLEERLGHEPTHRLAAAFVRGVYAGEIERLGAHSAFPRMWSMVQEHGSILRGLARRRAPRSLEPLPGPAVRRTDLLSFAGGLQELVDALVTALGDRLHLNTPVRALGRRAAGWQIETADGRTHAAHTLVLATPARASGALLRSAQPGFEPAGTLETVERADVTLVHLGFAPASAPDLPPSFGFLVPPEESARSGAPRALGMLFVSRLFPMRAPEGGAAVTCFYRDADLAGENPVERATADLGNVLGHPGLAAPDAAQVLPWGAILPQYTVGHAERMSALLDGLEAHFPGVRLAGNYLEGVGVEPVVAHGVAVARALEASLGGGTSR